MRAGVSIKEVFFFTNLMPGVELIRNYPEQHHSESSQSRFCCQLRKNLIMVYPAYPTQAVTMLVSILSQCTGWGAAVTRSPTLQTSTCKETTGRGPFSTGTAQPGQALLTREFIGPSQSL